MQIQASKNKSANRQNVKQWIAAIGQRFGLSLSMEDDGHIVLNCADSLLILIEVPEEQDLVFLYSPLQRLPSDSEQQTAMLKRALTLNNFSLETGGASFGFDPRTSALLLTYAVSTVAIDGEMFAECLDRFIELAAAMKSQLADENVSTMIPAHVSHVFNARA